MTKLVVDASVAFEWAVPEAHGAEARRLLGGAYELWAPDLLLAECGNALWKRVRRGEMTRTEAEAALSLLGRAPVQVRAHWPLTQMAMAVACQIGCSVYDGLYLALAAYERVQLVTADRKLLAAVSTGPLAGNIVWVADLA